MLRFSSRLCFGLVLGAGLLSARPQEEFPGLSEKWRHYQSPHFELYSAQDDYSSRSVLEHFELLRAVFLDSLKLTERLPQPVTIYYFDSDRDFRNYLPTEETKNDSLVGFCWNEADRTVVNLAPVGDDDMARVLVYHEFIDYLFQATEQDPARWFATGVGQVYSTMEEEPGHIVLGRPLEDWLHQLKYSTMFPFEQFFGMANDSETLQKEENLETFCAEAWAFVHYCRFGRKTLPKDKLEQFLRVAGDRKNQSDPERVRKACRQLLGCDYPELMRRLHRYVVDGDYRTERLPRPDIEAQKTYVRSDATREEMTDRLAELSLRVNRTPFAKLALLKAVDREPGEARFHEALGNDALVDGDMIGVREHWGKAVALGTKNPAIYRQLGMIESRRWFENFDYYFRLPAERAARLRNLLMQSIKAAPDQAGAYEMLAWVESAAPQIDVAHVNLVQNRFSQLTNKASTLLALALIRLRLHDREGARSMLDGMDRVPRNANDVKIADIIRSKIDEAGPETTAAVGADSPSEPPAPPAQPGHK